MKGTIVTYFNVQSCYLYGETAGIPANKSGLTESRPDLKGSFLEYK